MTKIVLLLNIIVLGIVDAYVTTRSVSSVPSSSPYPVHLMSTVDRRRASPPSSSTSSTSRIFPSVFPGQSLAHNLHEVVLGVLINSNGQNALSKQSLHDVSIMPASTIRPSLRRRQSLHHPPSSSSTTPTNQRTVQKVEKFERIPTWPARIGLQFNALSKINPPLAAKLEDQYGGADCPNLWLTSKSQQYTSSPEDAKDTIQIKSREKHTDFLVLAGQPLNQKVTARGSMVVETPDELEQAFVEYEKGDMGVPWSESCTDDEWRRHLRRTAK